MINKLNKATPFAGPRRQSTRFAWLPVALVKREKLSFEIEIRWLSKVTTTEEYNGKKWKIISFDKNP